MCGIRPMRHASVVAASRRGIADEDAARRVIAVEEDLRGEIEIARNHGFIRAPPDPIDRRRLAAIRRAAADGAFGAELPAQRRADLREDRRRGVLPAPLEQDVGEAMARRIHLEIDAEGIAGKDLVAQHDVDIAVAENDRRRQA